MAFHNGIQSNALTSVGAFASTGSGSRIVSFYYDEKTTSSTTSAEYTDQYFAHMAQGDILHCVGISSDLNGSPSYSVRYQLMGAATAVGVAIDDDGFPSGGTINRTRHYHWTAPSDIVLYIQVTPFDNRGFTNGISATAWISRPT